MKKKIVSLSLVLMFLITLIPQNVFAQGVNLVVNGSTAPEGTNPYVKNNRTMVPIRFVAENLGGSVIWNEELQGGLRSVYIFENADEDIGLEIFINKPKCHISEGFYNMGTSPEIVNGKTYVPIRFIANYLSFDVNWDANTNTVSLTKNNKSTYMDEFDRVEEFYDTTAEKRFNKFVNLKNPSDRDFQKIFEY